MNEIIAYAERLQTILMKSDWSVVEVLSQEILRCWEEKRQVFICGNGGSAGNAIHIANDFIYGVSKTFGKGIRAHALSANSSVMTCLANDTGYENIFADQLAVLGNSGDLLIVLSGSGNSANVIKAMEVAKANGIKTAAIVGYSGGLAKDMADIPVHFELDDMQISEDLQLTVCHMIMQWLYARRDLVIKKDA